MNKKSLLKTALVSAAILSGAGLFANTTQAQAATPATHAEQVRGVLKVVDHENQGEVHLFDRDGHVMKQTVKNGKKYKVWEKAYINDELMYRIGTDKQWIPAKYTDWKDAKLGQNVAVTSQKTNSAVNRENYVGVATINYQGSGNVRLVNNQGNYTSQYLPKKSNWKVWEKADINHEPMYRVGNQSQWVPAKYVSVSQTNTKSLQNNEVHHVSILGNNTNKSSDTIHNESVQRTVNNSAHTSKGVLQGNVNGSANGNSTSNTTHNTVPVKPVTPVTPTKPVDTKPAKPVTPSKPVTPTKSVDTKPVEPTTPTKPVEPSKLTTPNKPVEPTTPSKPVTPTTPTTPAKPTEPSKPVQPTQPTKPVQPTTPTDNNQGQRLTNSQYEQIFWDNYMTPAGWQKGNIPITNDIMKNGAASDDIPWSLGRVDTAYMQLYNGNYVNTPQSKAEFIQDATKLGNEYSWNDTSEYHKASIRATQPDNNSVRIDVLRYN